MVGNEVGGENGLCGCACVVSRAPLEVRTGTSARERALPGNFRLPLTHQFSLDGALAAGGFAAVLLGLLGHIWFASTPLPLGGPNVGFAILAVLLAALSLAQAAWSSRDMATVRRRVVDILPVMAVATLLALWALAVYVATDTLDVLRLAKMALGIGVLFAVFVCVDSLRRARAMVFLVIVAVFVSALWGFGVALVGDPFLSLWLQVANVPREELQEMLLFGRTAGLAAHISVFGRQVAVAVPLALAALLYCDCVASAPTRLNWCVSGSRKFPGKARSRADVPGRTSSGRNAAGGLPAATRRARPQASARFVAVFRSMARYTFKTRASRSDACERADASIQPGWSTRPWPRRAILAALFVVLMTLVTVMLMNATRSVVLSVCVVSLVVGIVALRTERPRRRLLVSAPLAALWLFLYFAGGDQAEDEASSSVGGVRGDIQDLATGDDAWRRGEADVLGHVFVGNKPGAEYQVQLRERYPAGYGQPGNVTVRADEQGTFVLTWRKRPGIVLYQSRLRVQGDVDWQEWRYLEPSATPDRDAPTLQDVVVGSDWHADGTDQQRIGHRVSGLEVGARYFVELKPEVVGFQSEAVRLPVTVGEEGAVLLTWRVPSEVGVLGYVYRLKRRGEGWGRWHDFEASMTVIAPGKAALDLAVGGESLGGSAKSARVGHVFVGLVSWFWYTVQIRQTDARGAVKIGEATAKPDEAGDIVLTWGEARVDSQIVSHQFRARKVSDRKWSAWQDFVPSLSSKVPTLFLIPADGERDVAMRREGGKTFRRHTLTALPAGLTYQMQFRARGEDVFGAETLAIDVYPDGDGAWTFTWREFGADVAATGYQFRLWWRAKDRWWPWQDFVPNVEGTGRTKVALAGWLGEQKKNVAAAQTTDSLGAVAKGASLKRRLMDPSAGIRIHELNTVLRYVRDHPFGTGVYAPGVFHVGDGLEDWLVEELLRLWPHNQGLHVLALFGWPGFALLVAFYICVLRPVVRCAVFAWRTADSDLRFLVIGVWGAWAAYSINTLFIPTSPFLGGWSHFYLIGLLFGVERIVRRSKLERTPSGCAAPQGAP